MTPAIDCQDWARQVAQDRADWAEEGWPTGHVHGRVQCKHPGCKARMYVSEFCPAHRPGGNPRLAHPPRVRPVPHF